MEHPSQEGDTCTLRMIDGLMAGFVYNSGGMNL